MKTINLQLNEEITEKHLSINSTKQSLMLKPHYRHGYPNKLERTFLKTARNAEKLGLKEEKLQDRSNSKV